MVSSQNIPIVVHINEGTIGLLAKVSKLHLCIYKCPFCLLALCNIMLIRNPIFRFSFIIKERMNIPLIDKLCAVFFIVNRLPKKAATAFQPILKFIQYLLVGLGSLQNTRSFTHHLLFGISGHLTASVIDVYNLRSRLIQVNFRYQN